MKRITAVVALLALTASALYAESVAPHLVTVPVAFRTQGLYATLAGLDPAKAKRTSGTSGYVDSLGFCRGAAAECTTAAIPLSGIFRYVGGDSLLGRLVIQEAAGAPWNGLASYVQKGLDSIYVNVEVSGGGSVPKWTRAASMVSYVYAVLDTTNGRVASFPIKYGVGAGALSVLPTLANLSGWPYIRFIVSADKTNSSIMEATWSYYSTNSGEGR